VAAGVLIVGAGGFGQSVAEALAAQQDVAGFVDDRGDLKVLVLGIPVLGRVGDLAMLRQQHDRLVVAIGDNQLRRSICEAALALDYKLLAVVHPHACCSAHAKIGEGAMVMAGAVVGTAARVGRGAIINAAAVVDHHAKVGDFAHLGVNACMAGGAHLGEGAWLQEGAVLRAGQTVAANQVVVADNRSGRPRDIG
jgi:sugar O-acyltransferase (sialic acid O-acetyltransferase NeuD family)